MTDIMSPTKTVHASPSTTGESSLMATNSRPVSTPSNPADTNIESATSICEANAGRVMTRSRLPTKGSRILKVAGNDLSCRRPSAKVT